MEFRHGSHAHPLKVVKTKEINGILVRCAACRLPFTWRRCLGCRSYGFFLHISCFLLSPSLSGHDAHRQHVLHLLYEPAGRFGAFECNLCGKCGDGGFSYRCKDCDFNVHALCTGLPRMVTAGVHQHHLHLHLPPLPHQGFLCRLCIGSMPHSFYKCSHCTYNAHPGCLIKGLQATQGCKDWEKLITKVAICAARKVLMHLLFDHCCAGEAVDALFSGPDDLQGIGDIIAAFSKDRLDMVSYFHQQTSFRGELNGEAASLIKAHMKGMV